MVRLLNHIGQLGPASQLVIVSLAAVTAIGVMSWRSANLLDPWLTADQQGRLLYEQRRFADSAERFADPAWLGVAQYSSGQYEQSAATFARIASPRGFYNRGNALMKNREYGKAITAYEQAVKEAPHWNEASENLALARYTLDYIESVREQSDTGDDSELSADDYVFDNTKERGKEMVITRESTMELESAEKWMRSVDTETRDFLRTRFLLEATREGGS